MASQLELDRRRMIGSLAAGIGSVALAGSSGRLLAQAEACVATPTETRGPFPADGTNGRPRISVLGTDGVIRRDLRASFAGMSGRADGVALSYLPARQRCGGA